ncbi:hypothetical protein V2A60_007487 [Cordyceps javanica]
MATANDSAKEERQLKQAIADSILSAARDMRPSGSPTSQHRLDTEPIARNEDYTGNVLEPVRLLPYQQSQSMSIGDYQDRLTVERFKMHFPAAELNEGDTLVLVNFPGDKTLLDCDGIPFQLQRFRVHSEKLLATGSSRFADMFLSAYQDRVQRRLGKDNPLPPGVKYILDLTPPSEGEEMAFQMTELFLTPGIIKWWSSYARLDIPFFLVKGHDDVCPCKENINRAMTAVSTEPISVHESRDTSARDTGRVVTLPLPASELISARDRGQGLQVEDVPAHFKVEGYCPIRHRNGIIRLLMLIEGKQVFIDSAPRLWTIVALAKIWDCVSAVQDPAIQWLLQGKNSKFIDILPEEAIKIGGILKSAQVTSAAFRILVNELALEQTASDQMKETVDFNHVTLFGRRKGDPGDEFKNLIQHAALAFVERMTSRLAEWHSPDIYEAWNIPAYLDLLQVEMALKTSGLYSYRDEIQRIDRLKEQLQLVFDADIKSLNLSCSTRRLFDQKRTDSDRATYVEPQDFRETTEIYGTMTPLQKLMTPFPYQQLEHSWAEFTGLDGEEDISGLSMASATQSSEEKADSFYKCYGILDPWDGDISPKQSEALSNGWLHPSGGLYPLMPKRLDVQVRWKLDELVGKGAENNQDLQTLSTKHMLLTLTHNETKFLPLWAGGLNDGTGGVFEDQLPPAEMGPNGPGPAYHTGITIPSDVSSLSGSFVDDMSDLNMAGSFTAASVDVHDSVSTVYRTDRVIADDTSIASESFQSVYADYHEERGDIVLTEALGYNTGQIVPLSLDDFLQAADSDSDSAATIGCDDFDTLDDDDDDLYLSGQPDSVADNEGPEVDMVMV